MFFVVLLPIQKIQFFFLFSSQSFSKQIIHFDYTFPEHHNVKGLNVFMGCSLTLTMFQTRETFGTQIKIFWMKSESCQTLPYTARVMKLSSPERYQKYCQNIPCDFSGSTVIYEELCYDSLNRLVRSRNVTPLNSGLYFKQWRHQYCLSI